MYLYSDLLFPIMEDFNYFEINCLLGGRRFSGKESFSHTLTTHGIDADTGLGTISEGRKKRN
jgi:hypothetical protein